MLRKSSRIKNARQGITLKGKERAAAMLSRKITVCIFVFLLIVIGGAVLERNVHVRYVAPPSLTTGEESVTVRSYHQQKGTVGWQPFLPREYVKMIRRDAVSEPKKRN